ncbi:MAG TPA: hypothetical protein VFZ79_13210 [Acidimicrobiales bacterium]
MPPSPDPVRLRALVHALDPDLAAARGGAILHAGDPLTAPGSLAWFPLAGAHPLDLLLGLDAPRHWAALGVSCTGRAHTASAPPEPVAVTILLDRAGAAAGVLRRGDTVCDMPDRPEGVVADACRRALGLPTAPPPGSTRELWSLLWLDRVVDAAAGSRPGDRPATWPGLAQLHPAASLHGVPSAATLHPVALAAAAGTLTAAWPWSRLRAEPGALPLPGPPSVPRLATWMDDGMWARWLLSHLPAADDLLSAVRALLPPALAETVAGVVRTTER